MLRELKTTLLGESDRTESGESARTESALLAEGADAVDVASVDDAHGTPSIGETDPFRPALEHDDESAGDELSMDRVFNLLGDQRRRYALTYLSTRPGAVTVNELVERVAVWECETQPERLSVRERERVHVSMCHSHLPKLADAGAISYDERARVERGDRFDRFSYYLCRDE